MKRVQLLLCCWLELTTTGDPRMVDDGKFYETPPMAGPVNDAEGAPRKAKSNLN